MTPLKNMTDAKLIERHAKLIAHPYGVKDMYISRQLAAVEREMSNRGIEVA